MGAGVATIPNRGFTPAENVAARLRGRALGAFPEQRLDQALPFEEVPELVESLQPGRTVGERRPALEPDDELIGPTPSDHGQRVYWIVQDFANGPAFVGADHGPAYPRVQNDGNEPARQRVDALRRLRREFAPEQVARQSERAADPLILWMALAEAAFPIESGTRRFDADGDVAKPEWI